VFGLFHGLIAGSFFTLLAVGRAAYRRLFLPEPSRSEEVISEGSVPDAAHHQKAGQRRASPAGG
jgi:hypothetical protein